MFERYTEKARRLIFFAAYEASDFGSSEITTEQLLVGLIREDPARFEKLTGVSPQLIREQIVREIPRQNPIGKSIDLPLSAGAKRVLAYSADEADRLRSRRIGTEHILLGLLREDDTPAERLLRQHGATLETVRKASADTNQALDAGDVAYPWYLDSDLGEPPEAPVQTSGEVVIEVEGLTKTYPGVGEPLHILRGIDLTVYKGEIIAIVGQSGSGKSTLLHILGTIDRPTGGRLRFGDQDPFALNAEDLAGFRRRSVGFVFQFHNLLPEFTALENVMMPRRISGHAGDDRLGVELLELVGLRNRLGHRPGELSGGEQQRVAIARALVNNPLLVLADEPTGALDNETGKVVFQLFERIQREKNLTSILATHNASIASRCNRLLRLENGRLHEISQPYV